MGLIRSATLASLALQQGCSAFGLGGQSNQLIKREQQLLQDIVSWDENSVFVNGERIYLFSGEFHPYRLPVPSLWLDIFQKIRALGLNCVSFYTDWALHEGNPGEFTADGIFAYEEFFKAAKEAGIYLIARPGPYINAEVSGGGFPGWLQRNEGRLRTNDTAFLEATDNYMSHMSKIIADAQITNGGPVILAQPENEYTYSTDDLENFPNGYYMQYVEDQLRNAGIVVPLISNDAAPLGHNAPGTGVGEVDIYGYDNYPLGFDCGNPSVWPEGNLPTNFWALHEEQAPKNPNSIVEFQGGAFDPPGGPGFENCAALVNHEYDRVFYKNNFAAGVKVFNVYMIFGGTNWGNLGHPDGYTSYDYGASIKEDRTVTREKYSELKLEAQFQKASSGFLLAQPENLTTTEYGNNEKIAVTPVLGPEGSFFVVRHANYASQDSESYKLKLPTSAGDISIPQLGGSLTLHGRDSKIHVTDYSVGKNTLLYSTAEVFTWQKLGKRTVLVLYGGPDELHELALKKAGTASVVEGDDVTVEKRNGTTVLQWKVSTDRRVVQFCGLTIYLLDRNSAYNYWVPDLIGGNDQSSIIVNGGYLVRSAMVDGDSLSLKADYNKTTPLEIIGAPSGVSKLLINDEEVDASKDDSGVWTTEVSYKKPEFDLPDLSSLEWYSIDSLPEVSGDYDDSDWPNADLKETFNSVYTLDGEPVSLYGADYGFNTGTLLFRGHFKAKGNESTLTIGTVGGRAFGASFWLNSTFLGSWKGDGNEKSDVTKLDLPELKNGDSCVLTVVIDQMGFHENWTPGLPEMKMPRGILNYTLSGHDSTDITWKITGNLGGEDYADHVRGPLNEGGLFIERQGYHQPKPPVDDDKFTADSSPLDGVEAAGIRYYTAKFGLDLPSDKFDIPLSFTFSNDTSAAGGVYRSLLYVNGYQYGRYTSNIGPQTVFPVPEGILNYNGENWIGLTIWAFEDSGAKLPEFKLVENTDPIWTGRNEVKLVDMPAWEKRENAY